MDSLQVAIEPASAAGAHSDQGIEAATVTCSRRVAVVVVSQHAAESLSTFDLAFDSTNFFVAWFNYQVGQSLMVTLAVVM